MAGHSKWANIKRTKEREDAKRSKEFSKVAKEIEVVVRITENGDPGSNPNLKVLVDKAKSVNMPKDKIEKAINRGLGIRDNDDEILYNNTYEFYGPSGTQLLVDCETENPNRTFSDIKLLGNKNGLKIANEGSISWDFETLAKIVLNISDSSKDDIEEMQLRIMEIEGVRDFKIKDGQIFVFTDKDKLKDTYNTLKNDGLESAELIKKANTIVDLSDSTKKDLQEIMENIEEMNEVVNIWVNFQNE